MQRNIPRPVIESSPAMRHRSSWTILLLGAVCLRTVSAQEEARSEFSFGALADCQYCDEEGTKRKYRLSPRKLAEAVEAYNRMDLEFVVHLGDFIDRDFSSFDVVVPIFERLKTRGYHVLGNHDFSVADERKKDVPGRLGLRARYYDFAVAGWRFLVVDGNDVSLYAHPKGSPETEAARRYHRALEGSPPTWNGAVGADQLRWIRETLRQADANGEKAVLFCHFPVYPRNAHNLWNADEVRTAIEESGNVVAWINGHNHAGHYGRNAGVHYLTLKGMVDTEQTAYSVVKVYRDRLEVTGRGRQESRTLTLDR